VAAGGNHTAGLKSDGSVLAVGDNNYGQLNVGSWTGIAQVAAGALHTVGLKPFGRAFAVGNNIFGQCSLYDWNLLVNPVPAIAQTPMSGPPGTMFVQWGTGFTPNGTATLHFKKPDGTEYPTQTIPLDNIGHFEIPYTTPVDKPLGTYMWWAIDDTNGNKSNEVSYVVQRDSPYFAFSPIPSPQTVGVPIEITITARNADESVDTTFNGEITLSATIGKVSPTRATLTNGSTSLQVRLDASGNSVRLKASGLEREGESLPFNVTGGLSLSAAVSGKVTNPDDTVQSNATVVLHDEGHKFQYAAMSDANGRYQLSNVEPGRYSIRTYYDEGGTLRASRILSVDVENHETIDLLLLGSACNSGRKTPILLVPGIMGSSTGFGGPYPTLPEDAPDWNESWGASETDGLHDPQRKCGWRNLMEVLEASGFEEGCTLFPVPYDWRMGVNASAKEYLKPWIDEAKRKAGTEKVNIIAHSMGGLVTRAYIQSKDYDHDIDKFAMVGTPNHGAGNAYYVWQGGDPAMADSVSFWNSETPLDISNFLHLYQMTMELQFWIYNHRPPSSSNYNWDMYQLAHEHVPALWWLMPTYDFLVSNGSLSCNTNQWLKALNESTTLERLGTENNTEGKVRTKMFLGDSTPTLTNIFTGKRDCDRWYYPDGVPKSSFLTQTSSSGDGTVLMSSAGLGNIVSYHLPAEKGSHAQLIDIYKTQLVQFVDETATTSVLQSASAMQTQAVSGTKELTVSILGRAQPYVVDPLGRESGIDPATGLREEGIPATTISMNGEGLNITIEEPVDGAYVIHLNERYTEDYQILFFYTDTEKNEKKNVWLYSHGGADSIGFSLDSSAEESLRINRVPAPPEGLQANPVEAGGSLKTRLCWNRSSSGDVTRYNLYSREEDEASLSLVGTTGALCFDTDHLWAGDGTLKPRIYAVSALKADGTESFLSTMAENNDRDHDGLSDSEESSLGTDMNKADTDGDGLKDSEEYVRGTDPLMKDTDGDGNSDYEEVQVGSDPLDPNSIPIPLLAEFSADVTRGGTPLTVHFTDNSSGVIASYEWDFGDGGSSEEKDPVHVYQSAGNYTVSLTVTGQGGTNKKTKTDYITVTNPADLSVSLTDSPDPVLLGATLTYSLQVSNAGPGAASGVVLTDTLPGDIVFVSAQGSQGSCSESSSHVTCSLGELAGGAGAAVQIAVQPKAAGTITNTATVAANVTDPNPANNTATVTTSVKQALDIKANGSDAPVTLSSSTPLSITVSLDPGNFTGYKAEWWIAANTPMGWYSYVYPTGWTPGIHLCIQKPLFNLPTFEVLNRTLPPGDYTFYYVLDGQLDGQVDKTLLDSVQVHVQ
jgi:uncharacterized repeat protein (TIGR01451 family)